MEINSPPTVSIERIIDLDIGFLSGDVRQFTLYEVDTYIKTLLTIEIQTAKPDEKVTIYTAALAWVSERIRMVERPVSQAGEQSQGTTVQPREAE